MRALVGMLVIAVLATSSTAGTGSSNYGEAAIHVVAHGVSCKSLPPFTYCSQINTTYIGTGDIDVIPVFFYLYGYSAIEFGLTWPAEWGTCSFVPCGDGVTTGSIVNPGDGISRMWTTCQHPRSVALGYGWLSAQSTGRVEFIPSPLSGRIGVTDCAQQYYPPVATYSAGVGWTNGDYTCYGAFTPLTVTVTDEAPGQCVAARDTIRYAIRIYNSNMFSVHDVALLDSLPHGTIYLYGGDYDQQDNTVRWDVGTMEAGDDDSLSLTVQVIASPGSIVTNHWIVTAREFWPRSATYSKEVCSGPQETQPTTWGAIKAIFR